MRPHILSICLAVFAMTLATADGPDPAPSEAAQLQKPPASRLPDPQMLEEIRGLLAEEEATVAAVRTLHEEQGALAAGEEEYLEAARFFQSGENLEEIAERVGARYALIRQAYELGLDRYPNNARLHNYLGELLYDNFGELDAALQAWHKAITLDKELSQPHNNLGIHYMRFGEYKRALEYLDRAIALDPKHPDYLYNMAQFYLMHRPQTIEIRGWKPEKVFAEAMKHSKDAMQLAPDEYEYVSNYAINFFKADEFGVEPNWSESAKAWAEARNLVHEEPRIVYTLMMEARAWLRAGENSKAVVALERVLELNPHSGPAQNLLERARAEV